MGFDDFLKMDDVIVLVEPGFVGFDERGFHAGEGDAK